ncbi:coiled-coil domain-containing protein 63-like [Leptodactylus fuscus]|uniref:coiled-coil domain-containing protein 63-like n=1 Tax=Leptodactylus fuscus TaxID=238119 RepID=UPI003F4F2DDD
MQAEEKSKWHLPSIVKKEYTAPTEQDLKKLQEQCRVSETMKASFRKVTEQRIHSQQKKINRLREQKKELKLTILLNRSQQNAQKDQKNAKKLCELTEAVEHYNHLIEVQNDLIRDLDIKIKEKEEEVLKQKREMTETKTKQSKINHLENDLQHVNQKYNVMKIENAKLKEGIECLRLKKKKLQNLVDKKQERVKHLKIFIETIQEEIMSAHKEKLEIQKDILAFKDMGEKMLKKYELKIQNLSRYVDHVDKQKKFLETKLFDRSAMVKEQLQKRQEKHLKKIRKCNQDIIDNHKAICEGLGNLFGQKDVDLEKMAKQYLYDDMKNDSLRTYVNELNSEVEDIKQKIKATEDEIFNLESQNKKAFDEQLIAKKELEEKLQKTRETTEKYQNKYCEMLRELELITSATEDLVKTLGCDISSMEKMLGYGTLTCQEKLKYFEILEKEIDELLQILNICAIRDKVKSSISSTALDSLSDTSDMPYSSVRRKKVLPSMPKRVKKVTADSVVEVLGFEELPKKVLHDHQRTEGQEKETQTSLNKNILNYSTRIQNQLKVSDTTDITVLYEVFTTSFCSDARYFT